jgi:hypothetical protein
MAMKERERILDPIKAMLHEWPPHARAEPSSRPAPAPTLSRSQKWELARIAAAGLVTVCALAGTAWMVVSQSNQAAVNRAELPRADAAPRVTIQTSEIVVPVITDDGPRAAVQPPTAAAPRRAAANSTRRAASTTTAAKSDRLPQRVARFITGDGRHEVRPFPTVPPER